MTRVLICGAGSYIGTHIAAHLARFPQRYQVAELNVQNPFDAGDFAGWDVVVHVAGIAHQKETPENAPLYTRVNRDLALKAARLAKQQGVRQFLFFSSMSVYGLTHGHITAQTQPAPVTHYGQSKWQAEQALCALQSDAFQVAVLRPPMVYGRGCRGNYPRLAALACSLPFFPKVKNERSMLYIDTLCAFVRRLIESGRGGLFFPQNQAYVCTSDMAKQIALCHGKKLRLVPGFGWLVNLLARRVGTVDKLFGSLTYDRALSTDFADEPQMDFAATIRQTEVGV